MFAYSPGRSLWQKWLSLPDVEQYAGLLGKPFCPLIALLLPRHTMAGLKTDGNLHNSIVSHSSRFLTHSLDLSFSLS